MKTYSVQKYLEIKILELKICQKTLHILYVIPCSKGLNKVQATLWTTLYNFLSERYISNSFDIN